MLSRARVPFSEAKAVYSHSALTKTPGVISQSTPSPVTNPPLKALVLPVFVVGSK